MLATLRLWCGTLVTAMLAVLLPLGPVLFLCQDWDHPITFPFSTPVSTIHDILRGTTLLLALMPWARLRLYRALHTGTPVQHRATVTAGGLALVGGLLVTQGGAVALGGTLAIDVLFGLSPALQDSRGHGPLAGLGASALDALRRPWRALGSLGVVVVGYLYFPWGPSWAALLALSALALWEVRRLGSCARDALWLSWSTGFIAGRSSARVALGILAIGAVVGLQTSSTLTLLAMTVSLVLALYRPGQPPLARVPGAGRKPAPGWALGRQLQRIRSGGPHPPAAVAHPPRADQATRA